MENESLDLIVSNCDLHWSNSLEGSFQTYLNSLVPDGLFIGNMIGGDTLQEARICLNLAMQEREGGVSPMISPMMSITDVGNVFSRQKFNMPTVDLTHM